MCPKHLAVGERYGLCGIGENYWVSIAECRETSLTNYLKARMPLPLGAGHLQLHLTQEAGVALRGVGGSAACIPATLHPRRCDGGSCTPMVSV